MIQQLVLIVGDLHKTQLHLDQKLNALNSTVKQYECYFLEIQKSLDTAFENHDALEVQNQVIFNTAQKLIVLSNQIAQKVTENKQKIDFSTDHIEAHIWPTVEKVRNRVNSHNENINYLKMIQDSHQNALSASNTKHDEHTNEIGHMKSNLCFFGTKLNKLNTHTENYTHKLDKLASNQTKLQYSMDKPGRSDTKTSTAKDRSTRVHNFDKSTEETKVITRKTFLGHYRPGSPPLSSILDNKKIPSQRKNQQNYCINKTGCVPNIDFENYQTGFDMNSSVNNTPRISKQHITEEPDSSEDMKRQLRNLQKESFYERRVKRFEMPV